ncbi:hypothetical protein [Nocardia sp. NBC_00511]|uniref:hypothetical protein n=1 Tax=Nocardia sp. NBC_00511 TaxID=2903591 RepID=UPI0030E0B8AF
MSTADRLRAEGEARGEMRGRAETVLEQLALRFGPVSVAISGRVRAADIAELRLWTVRVLDSDSLDAVFE